MSEVLRCIAKTCADPAVPSMCESVGLQYVDCELFIWQVALVPVCSTRSVIIQSPSKCECSMMAVTGSSGDA